MDIYYAREIAKQYEKDRIEQVIGIKFEGYTEADVDAVINRYKDMGRGPNTNVVTPIVTVVDLSGSMSKVYNRLKLTMKVFEEKIRCAGKRDIFFILVVIFNGVPRIVFCDSVVLFSADKFIEALPEKCVGKTPLSRAVALSDSTLEKLYRGLDEKELWYTIPVHLCITDAITTETDSEYKAVVDRYQNAVMENEKIVFEFVTQDNEKGLRLGGYRVFIDEKNYNDNIVHFMKALALASTSNMVNDRNMQQAPDRWDNREEFNRYMSAITITNFRNSFENKY